MGTHAHVLEVTHGRDGLEWRGLGGGGGGCDMTFGEEEEHLQPVKRRAVSTGEEPKEN